jgi:hypothetical protein
MMADETVAFHGQYLPGPSRPPKSVCFLIALLFYILFLFSLWFPHLPSPHSPSLISHFMIDIDYA